MSERHWIVVDCESTGLRDEAFAVEVAWWDLATGERGEFIPQHDRGWVLGHGEPRALELNGYRERLADAAQDDGTQARALFSTLNGHTIVGSNVAQDATWLADVFRRHVPVDPARLTPFRPWHHRMWELSPYAAGVLNLDELPGLWDLYERFSVAPPDHTAAADVTATGLVFRALRALRAAEAAELERSGGAAR